MDLRSEQGSSTILLIGCWVVAMGFLGLCFDVTLYYVARQQLHTAADAAATAGAMQARYEVTIEVTGSHSVYVWSCLNPQSVAASDPTCQAQGWVQAGPPQPFTLVRKGSEEKYWTPFVVGSEPRIDQRLERMFMHEGACTPISTANASQGGTTEVRRCTSIKIVTCELKELNGQAEPLARRAFALNRSQWGNHLVGADVDPRVDPLTTDPRDFRVTASAWGEMPTMFMRFFGYERLNVRAEANARYRRLIVPPPGCERT